MEYTPTIITFSHLRWDFVYQRPQHLLSRLASRYRVIFIEEPIPGQSGESQWSSTDLSRTSSYAARKLRPTSVAFATNNIRISENSCVNSSNRRILRDYVLWFYTPMALPLAEELAAARRRLRLHGRAVGVPNAPPRTAASAKRACSKLADVVFTGGPSLYRAKKDRHPNVHCFPSSVDAEHFAPARERHARSRPTRRSCRIRGSDSSASSTSASICRCSTPWPRRIRNGRSCMVGPVVKIDPGDAAAPSEYPLLRPAHVRRAAALSGGLGCLPAAVRAQRVDAASSARPRRSSTWRPSKPIVSTPITDVAEPYGDIVYLGETPEEFIAACERALARRTGGARRSASRRCAACSPAPRGTRPPRRWSELIDRARRHAVAAAPALARARVPERGAPRHAAGASSSAPARPA